MKHCQQRATTNIIVNIMTTSTFTTKTRIPKQHLPNDDEHAIHNTYDNHTKTTISILMINNNNNYY